MAAQAGENVGHASMGELTSKQLVSETAGIPTLEGLIAESRMRALEMADLARFDAYLKLILHWNTRINLTAIRDTEGILRRHFLESIACAEALPAGPKTLLDFGTGAGFPGVPIAICRPEIEVTLAESQNKKAAFLREVVSVLGLNTRIFGRRAETIAGNFDCVTMRAVDRMERAAAQAASLLSSRGVLALMTTRKEFPVLERSLSGFHWKDTIPLPGSDQSVLCLGTKEGVNRC